MGGGGVRISQEAFEELVIENMEDLGMDPGEALQDAVDTLTLQGVDLSGIVQCVPGQGYANDHPVVHSLDSLRHLLDSKALDSQDLLPLLHNLTALSNFTATDRATNLAIAAKKGGIELLTSLSSKIATSRSANHHLTLSTLNALACLLHDVPSAEIFLKHGGPSAIMDILQFSSENLDVLNACFSVVSAAATGNEILKESFMNLKIEERIIHIMKTHSKGSIPSLYDAIRVLLTSDDNCVVASQDEICRSVAEKGGIDSILRCIDDSGKQRNKSVARTCCSLLSKLAGSDTNKLAIAEKGGMDRLIQLSNIFYDDPSVLQEVMYLFSVLSLRSPDHATRAVEAGGGELAVKAMQKFPTASQLQRNACLMVRNLVVRNPENRVILLNYGIETIIRKARENHESCKAAATDALRDLGIANYNS